jgi:UDP-glucose 4-epimerase
MEVAVGTREVVLVYGDDYDTPDGTGVRDYVHVTDLSEAHLAALNYLEENNPSLKANLGTERGFSVLEVVRAARVITGKVIPVEIAGRRVGDPARVYAGASLAKKALGWNPVYREIEGILETHWKAYSAHQF